MFRWSYSRLADYEKCPAFYKYRHVDRLDEPKGPALERGIEIHQMIEDYLLDKRADLPPEYKRFMGYIDHVKSRPGLVVEDFWALTRDWKPTSPQAPDAWWRGKLDAYWREGTTAHVVDWKTGKIYPSNRDQMKLYAGVVMSRDAEVQHVVVELVYLDVREARSEDYTREHLPVVVQGYDRRAGAIERDTTFRARPNGACNYCAFAKKKGGPCSAG